MTSNRYGAGQGGNGYSYPGYSYAPDPYATYIRNGTRMNVYGSDTSMAYPATSHVRRGGRTVQEGSYLPTSQRIRLDDQSRRQWAQEQQQRAYEFSPAYNNHYSGAGGGNAWTAPTTGAGYGLGYGTGYGTGCGGGYGTCGTSGAGCGTGYRPSYGAGSGTGHGTYAPANGAASSGWPPEPVYMRNSLLGLGSNSRRVNGGGHSSGQHGHRSSGKKSTKR